MEKYQNWAKLLKVLSDSNRLQIVELLSCGELCACEIQRYFSFTQPTLSHHMKVLVDSGLVHSRRDGVWNYYTLNQELGQSLIQALTGLLSDTEDCPCKRIPEPSGNKSCCKP